MIHFSHTIKFKVSTLSTYKSVLFVLSVLFLSCKKINITQPQVLKGPYLSQLVERRYTPLDSITVTYIYNANGKLMQEQYSQQPSRRAYSIINFYQPVDITLFKDIKDQYRFYRTDKAGNVSSIKKYFAQSTTYWSVYESDTLLYRRGLLYSQYHQDYYFLTDNQATAFKFPLWLTKRYYTYDSQHQVIAETDSVFRTHDFPAGTLVINQSAATYLFTNRTIFEYGNRNEVTRKITESGADKNSNLKYSNNFSIYQQFGGRGYSTYDQSWPGRFLSGVTTYQYEYGPDGPPIKKTAKFIQTATQKIYNSSYLLSYAY